LSLYWGALDAKEENHKIEAGTLVQRVKGVTMKQKQKSRCEDVLLKPVNTSVSQIPPYPDAEDSVLPFNLSNENDPDEYRCRLAWVFDEDLTSAKWKHYLAENNLEEAYLQYKQIANEAGWYRSFDHSGDSLKIVIFWKDKKVKKKIPKNLLVFILPRASGSRILAGYKLEKKSKA